MSRHSASDISRPPSGASAVRNPDRPHSQVSLALGPRPRSLSRTGNVNSNKTGLQNRSSVVSVLWDSRCAPVDLCHPHLIEMRLRVYMRFCAYLRVRDSRSFAVWIVSMPVKITCQQKVVSLCRVERFCEDWDQGIICDLAIAGA